MITNIFIQARMSSVRYPGKVLAPILGVPLIKHVVDRGREVKNKSNLVVLTSTEISDDPLYAFLKSINCTVYRGSLNNVFERFQQALHEYPCDYFVRLCADSPFVDSRLIETIIEKGTKDNYELVSNVFLRTFPKGQSIEMFKSSLFSKVLGANLSNDEQEHIGAYFYKNHDKYKCLFFRSSENSSHINQCIDTVEDCVEVDKKKNQFIFDGSDLCVIKS